MLPRFFAPDAMAGTTSVRLPEDEALHATRVLRLTAGDAIRVFNGRGEEWRAEITAANRQLVAASLHEAVSPAPEPRCRITLALAVLKGDKMDDVVRDAVMLGAAAIQPLVTDRTEIALAALRRGHRAERWERMTIASAKQCGRAVVPPVHAPCTFTDYIAAAGTAPRVMLVEPALAAATRVRDLAPQAAVDVLIGPEGGWTETEAAAARAAGITLASLGAITLRADAVPLVALTAMRTLWDDM